MDHRRFWQYGDCLGAVHRCRYTDLYRSVSIHSFPMDNRALNQRAVGRPARLAGKQSAMEQLRAKLSRALALPPSPDAQVPTACDEGSRIEEGAPLEISWPNLRFPQRGEEGACEPVRTVSLVYKE